MSDYNSIANKTFGYNNNKLMDIDAICIHNAPNRHYLPAFDYFDRNISK